MYWDIKKKRIVKLHWLKSLRFGGCHILLSSSMGGQQLNCKRDSDGFADR